MYTDSKKTLLDGEERFSFCLKQPDLDFVERGAGLNRTQLYGPPCGVELYLDMYNAWDFKRKWASPKAAEWHKDLFDLSSAFGKMASSDPVAVWQAPVYPPIECP
jgi:hypothetical protein